MSENKRDVYTIICVLLVIGAGVAYYFLWYKTQFERDCKQAVIETLKSPYSAKFSDMQTSEGGISLYTKGVVDSQNSFGAMVRNKFICSTNNNSTRIVVLGEEGEGDYEKYDNIYFNGKVDLDEEYEFAKKNAEQKMEEFNKAMEKFSQ